MTMGSSDEWRLLLSEMERHMVLMHGGRNGCKEGNGETVRERERKKKQMMVIGGVVVGKGRRCHAR